MRLIPRRRYTSSMALGRNGLLAASSANGNASVRSPIGFDDLPLARSGERFSRSLRSVLGNIKRLTRTATGADKCPNDCCGSSCPRDLLAGNEILPSDGPDYLDRISDNR